MPEQTTLKRHSPAGMLMHWFNAVCWFWLLATGIGLIQNPDLRPMGNWYTNMMLSVFNGPENLLAAHWMVGLVWAGVWIAFAVIGAKKYTIPFIRQIVSFSLPRDIYWMIKKNLQMLIGHQSMADAVKPLGWDGRIPDQDYYNAGQKAAAIPMIGGGILLAMTGSVMFLSTRVLGPEMVFLVQWSITIHYIMAVLTLAVLLVHIFMAAISREERPAFYSMITGDIPADYAEHHHKIWYDRIRSEQE